MTGVCAICDQPIRYGPSTADGRRVWVHVKPGADHAPIPAKRRR